MISVHTNTFPMVWTVIFHAWRTVLVIHALGTAVLSGVAHQVLGTVRVIFTRSPGVPGGLFVFMLHHDIVLHNLLGMGEVEEDGKNE